MAGKRFWMFVRRVYLVCALFVYSSVEWETFVSQSAFLFFPAQTNFSPFTRNESKCSPGLVQSLSSDYTPAPTDS